VNHELLTKLVVNDFKVRYVNSYLGAIWAFIQPTVTIFVFWFVFQVGFKSPPVQDVPFILWLMCGIIPWFYYSDVLNTSTNCLREYSYLVNKVVFRVSLLPIVKILSALIVHIFFIGVIFLFFFGYGYGWSMYYIQIVYYIFALVILLTGLSWLTSAVNVFIKDMSSLIGVLLQVGFWITPIFWDFNLIQDNMKPIFYINPMFYIVQGFRDTFIDKVWFWERLGLTGYFWSVTIVFFILGAVVFRKLRPHFSDVL
jgi:ABC-type polysaccharide/polyol phosphate export permease